MASPQPCRYFFGVLGARLLRPLARRALTTLRPLELAIRLRNPWVRRREVRLGVESPFFTVLLSRSLFVDCDGVLGLSQPHIIDLPIEYCLDFNGLLEISGNLYVVSASPISN
jgi:hypothetical protein